MVQTERRVGEERTVTRHHFISGLKSDTKRLLAAVRTQLGHREDGNRVLGIVSRRWLPNSTSQRRREIGNLPCCKKCGLVI
jgi:hypothetical protein